jgi:hypothetical protein
METPMTRPLSTTARRIINATLAALVLATGSSQAGFAANQDAGVWRVNPATSKFGAGTATLSIQRAAGANSAAGSFLVISTGNVYLVTGAGAGAAAVKGVKQVDYSNIDDGSAVLIGTHAQSADNCGFRCMQGAAEPRMTVTFKAINSGEQQIKDMLASNGLKR